MTRVLSCSVFRSPGDIHWRTDRTEDRMSGYVRFLPALVRAHHLVWSGWELRIHHDAAVREHPYFVALARMHERGLLRLVDCGPPEALCLSMLWRLRPVFEDADVVISQDADSLPMLKLRRMAEEFLRTDKAVMLVHACESHDGVMGGGITVRSVRFRELIRCSTWQEFIAMAGTINWHAYSADEDYQRRSIWPMVRHDAIIFRNEETPTTIPCDDVRRETSEPVPPDVGADVAERTDTFAPYIGSAGYDLDGAFRFLSSIDVDAMRAIAACEDGVNVEGVMHP